MNMLKNIMKFALANNRIVFIVILCALVTHMLLSRWPINIEGAVLLLVMMAGGIGCNMMAGMFSNLKRSIVFVFLAGMFTLEPMYILFTDLLWESRFGGFLIPFLFYVLFGLLYFTICKTNKNRRLKIGEKSILIIFGFYCFVLPLLLIFRFDILFGRYGAFCGMLICIAYNILEVVIVVFRERKWAWWYRLADIAALIFYNLVFQFSVIISLSLGFLWAFFGYKDWNIKKKGLIFWSAFLIVAPALKISDRPYWGGLIKTFWDVGDYLGMDSLNFLLLYEVFTIFYAGMVLLRQRRTSSVSVAEEISQI
jgi:hypothetical protein